MAALTKRVLQYVTSRQLTVRGRYLSTNIPEMSEKHLARGSEFPPLTPGLLRLYSMRYCPFAQRTRLVLEYKNIPYETVNINLKRKPRWFLLRNPNSLVPVLEKDGVVVYESGVCNDYLDDMYPEPRLSPDPSDIMAKANDGMLIEGFGKVVGLFYDIPKSLGDGTYDKAVRTFKRLLLHYDAELGKRGKFFGGSSPCMVDFAIWPWIERMPVLTVIAPQLKMTKDSFPNLAPWIDRMHDLPCVQNTICKPEEHINFFKTLREGEPDYDFRL